MPGSLNVARTTQVFLGGGGGVDQPGEYGELRPSRSSSHALNCVGSNVTLLAPRYTNHDNRSPVAAAGMPAPPPPVPTGVPA